MQDGLQLLISRKSGILIIYTCDPRNLNEIYTKLVIVMRLPIFGVTYPFACRLSSYIYYFGWTHFLKK